MCKFIECVTRPAVVFAITTEITMRAMANMLAGNVIIAGCLLILAIAL
jgi:hypothetical protein